MKFGCKVLLRRGGGEHDGPGRRRTVLAKYVGARGNEVKCSLLEDDPFDTVGWNRVGHLGHWSRSAILAYEICDGWWRTYAEPVITL